MSDDKGLTTKMQHREDIEMGGRGPSTYESGRPASHSAATMDGMAAPPHWTGDQEQYQEIRSPGPYTKPTALPMIANQRRG